MDIFMQAAINETLEGLKEGGVPIGAVLVENGRIIGRGRNRKHIGLRRPGYINRWALRKEKG